MSIVLALGLAAALGRAKSRPGIFVATNANASFSVSVCGTPPFTYQWLFNGAALSDGGDIRGTLPQGVVGPVFNDDFGSTFGIIYAFTADGYRCTAIGRSKSMPRTASPTPACSKASCNATGSRPTSSPWVS